MASISGGVLTGLLARVRAGDLAARERVAELIYEQLREGAGRMVARLPGNTVHPTSLVHEALAKLLVSDAFRKAENRRYLFGAAAQAMRQLLVDRVRNKTALKRGGGRKRVRLDDVADHLAEHCVDPIALDKALGELEAVDARMYEVVSLKFFSGLTIAEIAEQMEVSTRLVDKLWASARAWLFVRLQVELR